MNVQQFKETLLQLGYKVKSISQDSYGYHLRYIKRNKEICIQHFYSEDKYNVYFDINRIGYSVELSQHGVKDFSKVLKTIQVFIKKVS